MADEKKQQTRKVVLEREYIVPLRAEWLKVQKYKRATKAVKALKQFMVKHMKVYDRDLRKIKVDIYLNNELRFRGMRKPAASIKVKAIKYDDGIVEVKLVDLPKHIAFELARNVRREAEIMKKEGEREVKPEENKEEAKTAEQKQDVKEKEESSKIATEETAKAQVKEAKHTSKTNQETPKIQRKALKR
jgi:large subunit ribosomal protein L31e